MTIEAGLRTYMLADATITTLIGTRAYPVRLPQDPTLSALVYSRVSNVSPSTYQGKAGYSKTAVQIDCWGKKYSDAKVLAEAVKDRLQDYVGAMGSYTVQRVRYLGEEDDNYPEMREYRTILEFEIWYLDP